MSQPQEAVNIVADGPVEVVIGNQMLCVNMPSGACLRIHSAHMIVIHYTDFASTEIYGDLTQHRDS